MSFSSKILRWYDENKRDLPWRNTKNPYFIWLSEIILQQTRVSQGLPYYLRFVEQFPTVFSLASASEEEVLKLWQGLGYYSRARNLHATAKTIVNRYNGFFPRTYEELLRLKGVGDYTASAIASICFDEPRPVVDGNVFRVLARYFGVEKPINSTEGTKYFKKLASEMMPTENICDYNQGIMEFGSLQCAPKNPQCGRCPFNESCIALQKNRVGQLPIKINKAKIRKRHFNYIVVVNKKDMTLLQQRTGKGIWQNLWEFPLLESKEEIHISPIPGEIKRLTGIDNITDVQLHNVKEIVHKLSHQHLHTRFWIVRTDEELQEGIPFSSLENYPVPVLIDDFIKAFKSYSVS